jgi:hypothetical protein
VEAGEQLNATEPSNGTNASPTGLRPPIRMRGHGGCCVQGATDGGAKGSVAGP